MNDLSDYWRHAVFWGCLLDYSPRATWQDLFLADLNLWIKQYEIVMGNTDGSLFVNWTKYVRKWGCFKDIQVCLDWFFIFSYSLLLFSSCLFLLFDNFPLILCTINGDFLPNPGMEMGGWLAPGSLMIHAHPVYTLVNCSNNGNVRYLPPFGLDVSI